MERHEYLAALGRVVDAAEQQLDNPRSTAAIAMAHVTLDACRLLRDKIENGATPWEDHQ